MKCPKSQLTRLALRVALATGGAAWTIGGGGMGGGMAVSAQASPLRERCRREPIQKQAGKRIHPEERQQTQTQKNACVTPRPQPPGNASAPKIRR